MKALLLSVMNGATHEKVQSVALVSESADDRLPPDIKPPATVDPARSSVERRAGAGMAWASWVT